MQKLITGFTMSLDGFIAGPNDDVGRLFKVRVLQRGHRLPVSGH